MMFLYFTRGTINADNHLYPDDPAMVELVLDNLEHARSFSEAAVAFKADTGGELALAIQAGATGHAFFDRSLQKCFYTLLGEIAREVSPNPVNGIGFFSAGILAAGPVAGLFTLANYWTDIRPHIETHFNRLKRWELERSWTQVLIHTECPIASSATYRALEGSPEGEVVLKDRRGRFAALIAGEKSRVAEVVARISDDIGLQVPANLEGRPINAAHTSFSDHKPLEDAMLTTPFGQPVCDFYGADGSILAAQSGSQGDLAKFFCTAIDGPLDTQLFLENVRCQYPVLLAIGSERALGTFDGIDHASAPEIRLLTTADL